MIQRELFDTGSVHPLHRVTDPTTSREAAKQHAASGARESHKRRLREALAEHPGLTSAEYGRLVGLERHEAARRLADLRNDGDAEQGPKRPCGVCRKTCVTWRPTEGKGP